jgi:glycosyltransferase involved in cell wall biosynthesis
MNRKLRVLECIRQGKIGGGESHLLNLVESLDRERFEPFVLSFTEGPMIQRLQAMGVETHVIYTEKPFDFRVWGKVKELLADLQPDIIHCHGTRATSNVISAARSLGIPVVYTIHGWSFHQDQPFLLKKMRILGERYITRRTDLNIAVSRANGRAGEENITGFRYELVFYGIDQQKFSPSADVKRPDVRAELGIPAEVTLVLFIARFTLQKQPLAMIEAFRRASSEVGNLRLLMVGDGELKAASVALAKKYNLGDKLIFQSFRQDVPDVLAAADIFVLPSLWEGLPIGLLEAMAMGKAVIASDVDGTVEVLEDEVNGRLARTKELVESVTRALVDLGKDSEKRRRLGKAAAESINEKYNVGRMTGQIEGLYLDVLGKKGKI